ncbi:MAG: Phenylalanyl-tRNA synthetase beta chain [Gammaproteobacteria bacterium]|nr:Phenylalanyl-tRNA synthetase beta chain [Gammaproteobacteria bacterium]
MKFSEQWLREWVNPAVTSEQLVEQLTMAGLEVDSIEPVAGRFSGVVVGHVLAVQPHPDADRLRVCQVDVGQSDTLNIVCGASNVREGIRVPVAVIGARLGADFTIKRAKLRGIESQGMICSAQELGLAETSQGILILADEAPLGQDFREYWQLNDNAITVELTPNRGDCASVNGLAREIAALNGMLKKQLVINSVAAKHTEQLAIIIKAPEACPRYVGRLIRNVNNQVASPLWLIERLRRSGLRSINPIVDVLNYVMLELGQPMHVFDVAKLNPDIEVRFAQADETLNLLNGQTVKLSSDTLVIADQDKALALAGIMGGSEAEVTAKTQTIFLESAFFEPIAMAGKARRYGLHTDSSYRFERGVDPALTEKAVQRASELIIQITGGEPGPIFDQISSEYLPNPLTIKLRKTRIKTVLGITIPEAEVQTILTSLDMQVTPDAEAWQVQIPAHRFDIKLEIDLIEELARIYGYDKIPQQAVQGQFTAKPLTETQTDFYRLRNVLIDRGYREAITYSFVAPKLNNIFAPEQVPLELCNPISAELAVMRSHLWPGLLGVLQHNQHRQQERIRLFEIGLKFNQYDERIVQQPVIGGIVAGTRYPEQWASGKEPVDFFDVKADIEALLALTGRQQAFSFVSVEKPGLHPGQTAKIICDEQVIGYIGALHPLVAEQQNLTLPIYLFELDISIINQQVIPSYTTLSKYPSIRRDLAFLVEQNLPVADLLTKIRNEAKDIIKQVQLFDVYQGKGIPIGQKSVALGIIMQHAERTLIDEEVNQLIQKIISDLQQAFGVKLREE